MGFRKQGKGGIYFKETEEVSATFEGNKQTQKMLGKWNTGKQIFDFWGTSKFISDKQNLIFKVTIPPPPGHLAQSVTCLVTDAKLTADPGVASSIPARSHTFVEIDHERISTVILLPSAESFMKGCCQLQAKVC